MKDTRISIRYARAFLNLAIEQKFEDKAFEDMVLIESVCEQSKDFRQMLSSPIVKIDKKLAVFNALFGTVIHPVTLSYLTIIARKKRERSIHGISYHFCDMFKENRGIVSLKVTMASQFEQVIIDKLKNELKILLKKEIDLHQAVNKELVGGFIINLKDQQYDASVATKLTKLAKELNNKENIQIN